MLWRTASIVAPASPRRAPRSRPSRFEANDLLIDASAGSQARRSMAAAASPAFTIVADQRARASASAPTRRSSASSTRCCCSRFPIAIRIALRSCGNTTSRANRTNNVVSPGNYLHWREMNQSFEDMAGVSITQKLALTAMGDPEELAVQIVNATLFPILGVSAAHGRVFTAEEDRPSHDTVAVISDRLWRRRFGGDPAVVNTVMHLAGIAVHDRRRYASGLQHSRQGRGRLAARSGSTPTRETPRGAG